MNNSSSRALTAHYRGYDFLICGIFIIILKLKGILVIYHYPNILSYFFPEKSKLFLKILHHLIFLFSSTLKFFLDKKLKTRDGS